VLLSVGLVMVGLGRHVEIEQQVRSAAAAAAQAAVQQYTAGQAIESAQETALLILEATQPCDATAIEVDTGDFVPGGSISVQVRCSTGHPDGAWPDGGTSTFTATATAGIDPDQLQLDRIVGADQ
jgi:Flp pilus assembly protein TadG